MKIENIQFTPACCRLRIDGREAFLTTKITPVLDGKTFLNITRTEGGSEDVESRDPRLVELTARWWLWANEMLPESAAQEGVRNEADAQQSIREYQKRIGG